VAGSALGNNTSSGTPPLIAGYAPHIGHAYYTPAREDIIHPLKEVDAAAMAWAQKPPKQVVEVLKYVTLSQINSATPICNLDIKPVVYRSETACTARALCRRPAASNCTP